MYYNRYLWQRSIAADGFFSADHLKSASKRKDVDVRLFDGDGFMTREGPYSEHLLHAIEVPQVWSNPLLMFTCAHMT